MKASAMKYRDNNKRKELSAFDCLLVSLPNYLGSHLVCQLYADHPPSSTEAEPASFDYSTFI